MKIAKRKAQNANQNGRPDIPASHNAVAFRSARLLLLFAMCYLPFAALAFSCAKPVTEQRGRNKDIIAESSAGRIEAIMSSAVGVPAARAAAEQTLRARGYVITETFGTDDKAKIKASGTGNQRTDTTTVEAWRAGNGTRLRVDVGLFGDTAAARSILDETIARLGR